MGGMWGMPERRMFTKKITESDNFTTLPPTTQALYFHLCMGADDDGFSNQIRHSMFNAHADINDFNLLVQQRFIIPFDNGVVVIKHWRMHNLIRSDRYHQTDYLEERATLLLKENGVYTENLGNDNQLTTSGIPTGNQLETEVRLGKDNINNINAHSENEKLKAEEFFNEIWKLYPRKKGKSNVSLTQKKKLMKIGYERLAKCIEKYKKEIQGRDENYVLYGSSFFNKIYKDYLDDEPTVTEIPEEEPEEEMSDEEWARMVREDGLV